MYEGFKGLNSSPMYNFSVMSDDLNEAAKQALELLGDTLRKITGPLADEFGETLGIWARHYRYKLGIKMFQKTQRMLEEAGITPQAVSPRLFLPILDNASIEDDEDLHSRWAALLANAAACPNTVHPSFIELLRQLTPDDAHLLDKLYNSCESKRGRMVTPWVNVITYAERERRVAAGENPEQSFQNLIRLGLIQADYDVDECRTKVKVTRGGKATVDAELERHYDLAEFAFRFVRACRAPKTIDATPPGTPLTPGTATPEKWGV